MKKLTILAIFALFSANVFADNYVSVKQLNKLKAETANMLVMGPQPSDAALILRYGLSKRDNHVWDAPYSDGDDPSPAPDGFYWFDKQGLHAYIGWGSKPSTLFSKVSCKKFINNYSDAFICSAKNANAKSVAKFQKDMKAMLQAAD